MSSEEKNGEVCEICKDAGFVGKFCAALGGGEDCVAMSNRAAEGRISQDKYYEWAMDTYGREKVAEALEKASLETSLNAQITGVAAAPGVVAPSKESEPDASKKVLSAGQKKGSEPDAVVTIGGRSEVEIINDELKRDMKRYKSAIPGICLPCVGEGWTAVLEVSKKWFTKNDAAIIEREIALLSSGAKNVEDCVSEILKLKGADTAINTVLGDMSKVIEAAMEQRVRENPGLAQKAPGSAQAPAQVQTQ